MKTATTTLLLSLILILATACNLGQESSLEQVASTDHASEYTGTLLQKDTSIIDSFVSSFREISGAEINRGMASQLPNNTVGTVLQLRNPSIIEVQDLVDEMVDMYTDVDYRLDWAEEQAELYQTTLEFRYQDSNDELYIIIMYSERTKHLAILGSGSNRA